MVGLVICKNEEDPSKNEGTKLRSEIVWHRFFAVPAFIRNFRSYIAVRKLLV